MKENILVVAAHPDDEVLGCGGTIVKHTKAGDKVRVVILAEGVTSRDKKRSPKKCAGELSQIAKAAQDAGKILGVESVYLHNFPDNRMDSIDLLDVVKVIEDLIERYEPDVVYSHHGGDLNIDHRIIHEAVVTACRPVPGHPVKTILFFEIPSSTEWRAAGTAQLFAPNWFVDVSNTLALKMKALASYQSEMRDWPHVRSVEAIKHLAAWRGATVGTKAAEAFVVGRNIVRYP